LKNSIIIIRKKDVRRNHWLGTMRTAILFGDGDGDGGGAVVLRASEEELGLIDAKLSLVPNTREVLSLPVFEIIQPSIDSAKNHYDFLNNNTE
jgi:3-oxoacyl-[acyl-carrier-protein] synthase III